MSEDEFPLLMFSVFVGCFAWGAWYFGTIMIHPLASRYEQRAALTLTPPACAVILLLVLTTIASHDVVNDPLYIAFYMFVGAAWVGVIAHLVRFLGIHPFEDVAERANTAAGRAIAGALIGATFCFAGGNIGSGPGWWVVLIAAGLATSWWLFLWVLVEAITGRADAITIERDGGAGLRHGAWLAACGLILGRAAAGDWVSLEDTVGDFVRVGWPSVLLLIAALAVETGFRLKPIEPETSFPLSSAAVSTAYVGAALLDLALMGAW